MSSFLAEKPLTAEDMKVNAEKAEMSSLALARGFSPKGSYHFKGNQNVIRKGGSIINGTMVGSFSVDKENLKPITFNRENFGEKAWKIICTYFGFKYHVSTDIDSFTVIPSSIEVGISVVTPTTEVF